MAITPTGMPYDEIEPQDIVITDLGGNVVEGHRRPSSELPFHSAVLRARPDIGAVVHTHSLYATTLAILGRTIPAVHYVIASLDLSDGAARARTRPTAPTSSPTAITRGAGRRRQGGAARQPRRAGARRAISPRRRAAAELLEFLATVYHHALAVGEPVVLPDEEIAGSCATATATTASRTRPRAAPTGRRDDGRRGRSRADDRRRRQRGQGDRASRAAAGRLRACVRRGYRASFPAAGLAEWEPAAWWRVVLAACREAVAQAGAPPADYAGLTATGMRGPFVLVDGAGEHVAPGVLVPDQRGAALPRADRGGDRPRAASTSDTGHWLSARWGLSKLLWFADGGAGRARARAPRAAAARLADPAAERRRRQRAIVGVDEPAARHPRAAAWATRPARRARARRRCRCRRWSTPARAPAACSRASPARSGCSPAPRSTPAAATRTSARSASCAVEDGAIAVVAGTTTAIQLTDEAVPARGEQAPLVSAHLRPGQLRARDQRRRDRARSTAGSPTCGADGAEPTASAALERARERRAARRARPARHRGAAALGRGGVGPARARDAVRRARRALARRPRARGDRVRDLRDRGRDRRARRAARRRPRCGSVRPAAPAAARCGRRRSPTCSGARSRSPTSPSRRRPAAPQLVCPGAERRWGGARADAPLRARARAPRALRRPRRALRRRLRAPRRRLRGGRVTLAVIAGAADRRRRAAASSASSAGSS